MRNALSILLAIIFCTICSDVNAQTLQLRKIATNANPNVGEPFEYRIQAACQSTTRDCESTVITDVLPASLEFLNFSNPLPDGVGSATFDPNTNTATITFDATSCSSCTPDGINTDNDDFAQGSTIELSIQVRFPNGTFTGTTADNRACATSNNAGNPCDNAVTVTARNGRDPQTGCDQIFKSVDIQNPVAAGSQMWIRNRVGNLGTATINNYSITTDIPAEADFEYVQVPNWPDINQNGSIEYQREDQPGVWHFWRNFNVSTNGDARYYETDLGLPAGVDVSRVRMNLGNLSGDGSWNPYLNSVGSWQSSFRVYSVVEPGTAGGTNITGCSTYTGTVNGINCNDNLCDTNTVSAPGPVLTGSKDILDQNGDHVYIYSPGDIYEVELSFASDEVNNQNILGGVMVDILPPGMTYIPGSEYIMWGHDNIQYQNPVVQTQTLTDGRQLVRFVWDASLGNEFNLAPVGYWQGFALGFDVQIGYGVNTGYYTNEYYYTATGSNHGCEYTPGTDTNNYMGGYAYDSDYCTGRRDLEVIRPPSSAGLESYKEVRGSKNANYNRYPDYGTTVPGGVNDYRLTLTNPNSTPINDITIIDVFPYVGDTELLNGSVPRYTEWRPNLLGPISAPAGTTVSYTTVTNPCRNELAGTNPTPYPAGCSNANWSTTPPADITDVTGIKLDLNITLNQGDTYELEWEMRAPVNAPVSGEIAWNSFAYIASNANTGEKLIPAEPIKVGIETFPGSVPFHGDFVWHDVNGNGVQDAGEPGIDGVTVTLYQDNGNGIADPNSDTPYMTSVTANGGLFLFSDFPLGDYYLVFSNLPAGFNATHTDAGNDDSIDSDGLITPVTRFTSTSDIRTCDLGLFQGTPPPLCEVGSIIESWNYGCGDNRFVDIYGVGTKWNLPSTINIPNPGNVTSIVAIGTFRNDNNDCVEFSTPNETQYIAPERLENRGCGVGGYLYRTTLGPASSVTIDAPEDADAESFIIYVFRNDPIYSDQVSYGDFLDICLWRQNYCQTYNLPTQESSRDITLKVPLSEITNDGRVATITATACGQSASVTINNYNTGNSLNMVELIVEDVPGNCTSIELCANSPYDNGQSLFLSGSFSMSTVCCDLTATVDAGSSCGSELQTNGGYEDSGSTSFNSNYQGIPARQMTTIDLFPSWTPVPTTGSNNSNFLYLNDIGDLVNNPEGDKFIGIQQSGNCWSTDLYLTAGECYSFSFKTALFGTPGTNVQVQLEHYNGDPSTGIVPFGEVYIDTEDDLSGLTWYTVTGSFTPTSSLIYTIYLSMGNVTGAFDGALFIDDFKASQCCNLICYGESITLTANASSSYTPITYNWSNNSTSRSINVNPTSTTTYSVTVTDARNCTIIDEITVDVNPELSCTINEVEKANCENAFAGSAVVVPQGGSGPFLYRWDNGETTATATSLNIGPHSVTVTDANNCTTVCSFDMEKEPPKCTNIYTNGFSRTNSRLK